MNKNIGPKDSGKFTKERLDTFGFSTAAIHAGQKPVSENGAIMTPIYQTSTFVQDSPGMIKGGVFNGYEYARSGNPTRTALEANLASAEGGNHAYCFSSGCAAANCLIQTLSAGDHVLCCDDLYGGTFRLFDKIFSRFGIEASFVDLSDPKAAKKNLRANTKMVWIETPTNPMLKVLDIAAICEQVTDSQAKVVVDNTFASPYLQQPLSLGADIVLHSSTKYLGGHSDVVGGALIVNDDELAEGIYFLQNAVGAVPAPMDCFLLLRSTKTLAIRMEQHAKNAQQISTYLEESEEFEKVIYPGLNSHPQKAIADKQMKNPGGMITAILKGGLSRARNFLESVEIFALAESLGGVESLVEHPAIMTHASIPAEQREKLGIHDGLIRLSVGIENIDDLLDDLKNALKKSR